VTNFVHASNLCTVGKTGMRRNASKDLCFDINSTLPFEKHMALCALWIHCSRWIQNLELIYCLWNGIFLGVKTLTELYTESVANDSFICCKELHVTLSNVAMNVVVDLITFPVENIQL